MEVTPDVEQRGMDGLLRAALHDTLFVCAMRVRLVRGEKARAERATVGSQREHGRQSAPVGKPSRGDHRKIADRVAHFGH